MYFTAVGMIDIPTEQEILAMMEEMQKKSSVVSFYRIIRKTVQPISELHRIGIKPKHPYVALALEVSFCYSVLTFRFLLACIQFLFYLVNSIYQPLNLNGRFFRMKNSKRHSIIPIYWNDSNQWMNTFPALECQ